jgi:hypothetical protein
LGLHPEPLGLRYFSLKTRQFVFNTSNNGRRGAGGRFLKKPGACIEAIDRQEGSSLPPTPDMESKTANSFSADA